MAASDQYYRNQRTLDIVFAVSCVLMLLSIVWMFAQDYYRPFKSEQRVFRDVEVAMNQHLAVLALPNVDEILELEKLVVEAQAKRSEEDQKALDLQKEIDGLRPKREKAEVRFQDVKAQFDSKVSLYDIAVEQNGPQSEAAKNLKKQIADLRARLDEERAERDRVVAELLDKQRERDKIDRPLTEAMTRLKKSYEKFDALVNVAQKKDWNVYDTIRSLPVLEAFASPIKIQQYTNNDIPIDYNFKFVTRFDRCTTCHLGIDKNGYSKENLYGLRIPDAHDKRGQQKLADLQTKLAKARMLLEKRRKVLQGLPEENSVPDPNKLVLTLLSKDYLTDSRVSEFAAHPRLDLFVGSNSKHPVEKFGCTSCHAGQGSATDFYNASHFPDNADQAKDWKKHHDWGTNHFWDFPMLPSRFVEASCAKCHHEITDLITSDNKNEAPKLVRGYNLVRELGCFGCHEIAGIKNGKRIGPDLRLEPTPPVEKMLPEDRIKVISDPDNPPGTYAKVGPSLYRISEKTNKDWAVKWLSSPRSFRPDTKMPHFYNLSNNSPDVLPEAMKNFPAAEMHSVAYYLFHSSNNYLKEVDRLHKGDSPATRQQDAYLIKVLTTQVNLPDIMKQTTMLPAYAELKQAKAEDRPKLFKDLQKAVADEKNEAKKAKLQKASEMITLIFELRDTAKLSDDDLAMLEVNPRGFLQHVKNRIAWRDSAGTFEPLLPEYKADAVNGRKVFSERGCLACHHHDSTMEADEANKIPALPSEQHFGPDLSQVKAKLGRMPGDKKSAAVWLANWIRNPKAYNPRTTMPVVPMTDKEVLDVTAWILDQPPEKSFGSDWEHIKVETPADEEFFKLADVYLERLLPRDFIDTLKLTLDKKRNLQFRPNEAVLNDLPADERELVKHYSLDNVKNYLGKKAVGRLGCFACHDIPGFDDAKNIGVGLNDWGKKDPGRLAFEDIEAYVQDHYYFTDHTTVKQGDRLGQPHLFKKDDGGNNGHGGGHGVVKKPYENFFKDALFHHDRIGYLNQKLMEPRSYDYNRVRAWDDLSRMPQFKFARPGRKPGESDNDYQARAWKEEAEAREAVMTFVLGLVAEPVPERSVNTPKGDRLAEIKGRKVLEKFNCAGCHMIQPGTYEFDITPQNVTLLQKSFGQQSGLDKDYDFPNHHAWSGKTPKAGQERLTAYGLPKFDTAGKLVLSKESLALQLSFALRFEDLKGLMYDIRGKEQVSLPVQNMVYPPAQAFQPLNDILNEWKYAEDAGKEEDELRAIEKRFSEAYRAFAARYGAYGGTFAGLLPEYLATQAVMTQGKDRLKEFGKLDTTTNRVVPENLALAASPPQLIGEGERTQPEWLYQFLLNPQPIRKIVVLRMPHFNLSQEEARALVEYFGATARLSDPKNAGSDSFVPIAQQTATLDEPYWRQKTVAYVQRLKKTKTTDGKSAYELKQKELRPVWERMEQAAKDERDRAQKQLKTIQEAIAKLPKTPADGGKDQKEGAKPDTTLQDAERVWKDEVARLDKLVQESALEKLQKQWEEQDAYVADAFRMLGSNQLCAKCHQIGSLQPAGKESEGHGPPLAMAHRRLKPGWIQHWVANPPRLLPYSPMPQYFSNNPKEKSQQNLFVGDSFDQIQALTDVLMIYDRAIDMPINRYWTLQPALQGKKE